MMLAAKKVAGGDLRGRAVRESFDTASMQQLRRESEVLDGMLSREQRHVCEMSREWLLVSSRWLKED